MTSALDSGTRYAATLLAWIALVALLLAPLVARAQEEIERTNVLIILDTSGSMAGRMGGKVKMDIARGVVRDLVDNMPSDMKVGLLVYGAKSAREKNDCNDIDLLRPVQPVQVHALDSSLDPLRPRGMTPIGASLRRGAEALKGLPGKSTIVLISDGTETCNADPCQVAKEVRESTGIDVKVHSVGLDIGASERGTLECVATGGGGTYYPVKDEEQLRTALKAASQERTCRGNASMWKSIAHPGWGEMANSGKGFKGMPKKKFYLGFIPFFGWPGYLQIVSAIDARNCRTNDWLE
ncbi:MAG: VWA domain-containing protein [Myxococcota bacterium]